MPRSPLGSGRLLVGLHHLEFQRFFAHCSDLARLRVGDDDVTALTIEFDNRKVFFAEVASKVASRGVRPVTQGETRGYRY